MSDEAVKVTRRPVGQNSAWILAAVAVSNGIGVISAFEIARHIATNSAGLILYGGVQVGLLLANSVEYLGDIKISQAFTYFLGSDKRAMAWAGSYFWLRVVLVGTVCVSIFFLSPYLGLGYSGTNLRISLALFLLLPILWTPGTMYQSILWGLGDSAKAQVPETIEVLVSTGALVLVALTLPTVNGVPSPYALFGMTGAFLAGGVASCLYSVPFVWRARTKPVKEHMVRMVRYAFPLAGSQVLTFVSQNFLPIVAVELFGAGGLAILGVGSSMRSLLVALGTVATVPIFPQLAGLFGKGDMTTLRSHASRAIRYTAMVASPAAAVLAVYSLPTIRVILSNAFVNGLPTTGGAAIPMTLLVMSAAPMAVSAAMATVLFSVGRQRWELYVTSTQVTVLFGVIFFAGPALRSLGIFGVAVIAFAAVVSSVVSLGMNAYFVKRAVGLAVPWGSGAAIAAAIAVESTVLIALGYVFPIDRWYQLAIFSAVGIAAYTGILLATRELSKQDILVMGRSLGLPEWVYGSLSRIARTEAAGAA